MRDRSVAVSLVCDALSVTCSDARAIEMIGEGEIVDAKTQIGLLMIGGRR